MNKPHGRRDIQGAARANLPIEIFLQREKADRLLKTWTHSMNREELCNPKRGRPRSRSTYRSTILVFANSQLELNQKLVLLHDALGPRTRGNKRYGYQRLYLDLLEVFLRLKRKGITLPKSGSLSAKAVSEGIGQVLKDHFYTDRRVDQLVNDLQERRRLGKVMKSVFGRLADSIKRNPH